MKKIFLLFFALVFVCFQAIAVQETSNDIIRIRCDCDKPKKAKYNNATGMVFTFTLKDGKLYGKEGELIKNAIVTDEEIKGKLKYKNGLSWENTRFQINRYTGVITYHTIYRTLETYSELRNTGICTKIENEQKF